MFNIMVLEDIEATGDWMKALLLKTFPDVTVIVCHTLAEAREQSGKQSLALALLDLNLPDGSGLEIIPLIRQQNPETRIIVMTIFDDQEHIFKAIRAGAMGYLLKDQSEKILINKLRGVMEGDPPLSPAIARKILEQVRSGHEQPEKSHVDPALHINLNHREEEILILISKGMNGCDQNKIHLKSSRQPLIAQLIPKLLPAYRSERQFPQTQNHPCPFIFPAHSRTA